MPELPELEVLKHNILAKLKGEKVVSVYARKDRAMLSSALAGKILGDIARRGKYLIFKFGDHTLLLHLLLSGRIFYKKHKEEKKGTTILAIEFENGYDLRVEDRRFWTKVMLDDEKILDKLGPEPYSDKFSFEYFKGKVQKSRSLIKPLLMKQEFIAGIGNAYVDELLFDAGINPRMYANMLNDKKVQKLYNSIKKILKWAIEETKKSVGNEVMEDEARNFTKVYRKEGQKCPHCQSSIKMIEVNGRDTFYCLKCQPINSK